MNDVKELMHVPVLNTQAPIYCPECLTQIHISDSPRLNYIVLEHKLNECSRSRGVNEHWALGFPAHTWNLAEAKVEGREKIPFLQFPSKVCSKCGDTWNHRFMSCGLRVEFWHPLLNTMGITGLKKDSFDPKCNAFKIYPLAKFTVFI